ncbi:MAG: hypothetical protein M3Z24_14620 [Chloroflexota bacterium]|nr:hypothetical protein [Chloroflexota bacterium]
MNTHLPASTIILDAQSAKAINRNCLPTELTNTFSVEQPIYVTYKTNTQGQDGYIKAKWYSDGDIQKTGIRKYDAGYTHGYFTDSYDMPTNGKVEFYWCTTSDCSDEQLNATVDFTVTS